jgi:Txe/YoeB family toxin of Txe-Axe toxin-antitoxin module
MLKKVAIVIPFYKNIISGYEKIALRRCQHVLSQYPKVAIKPANLTLPNEASAVSFDEIISFEEDYFNGLEGYNRLMLSSEFYSRFLDYEYILIYQMDCFVFKDDLHFWCQQDFDYIGAPWIRKTYHKNFAGLILLKIKQYFSRRLNSENNEAPNKYQLENKVGNGGFSLRRVKKLADLCIIMKPIIDHYLSNPDNLYNEDVFWSIEVNRQKRVLNIPSCETGLKFAFEVPPVKAHLLNEQNLPFGCHDWDKYADYWRPVFKRYNYDI